MKKHLKLISSPRTWHLPRKKNVFITRPRPGAHAFSAGLPLTVILRDSLQKAATAREVKKVLHANEVLVDGKRRKDHRYLAGLFDVLSFANEHYRITLDNKGRLLVKKIDDKEKNGKVCKIVGKTVLKGNKIQYQLHDGKTLLLEKQANVGDSVVLEFPNKVKEILPLKEKMHIFLTRGKYAGTSGVLKSISGTQAIFTKDGKDIETAKKYLFVVGTKGAVMNV